MRRNRLKISDGFSMEQTSGRTGPPKRNIVLFLHSGTMAVTPSVCTLRTKVGTLYSIKGEDLFFREHYGFEPKIEI